MRRYFAKRLGLALITLVLVSIAVFGVAEVLPGDVGRTILGPYASNEQVAALNHELGNDQPILVRYGDWIGGFVTGDWGESQLLKAPARSVVGERLKNSFILGSFALLLIVPISIALGVLAALHYGKALDRMISVTGLSLIALPEFVGGVILIVVFAVELGW